MGELESYGRDFIEIYDDLFVLNDDHSRVIRGALGLGGTGGSWAASSVLDLGAGNGRLAPLLMEMGFKYTALDISPEMVCELHHRYAEFPGFVSASVADISGPYLLGASFDVIVIWGATLSMMELEIQKQVLREALRHLSPGGRLLFQFVRRDLVGDSNDNFREMEFPRRSGAPVRAFGCRRGNWLTMSYSWCDGGKNRSASDSILLTVVDEYSEVVSESAMELHSLSDEGLLGVESFGASDVILLTDS